MVSKTSICSDASLLIGGTAISDLTHGGDTEQLTSNLYDEILGGLLRSHTWNFAVKRAVLSPLTKKPAFGYAYAYLLPSDFVRLLEVGNAYGDRDYTIESGELLANTPELYIRYVYKADDPNKWTLDFLSLVKYSLAAQIAFPITGSASLKQLLMAEAAELLRRAKSNNGLDIPPTRITSNPLKNARY